MATNVFSDVMAYIGQAVEARFEREQVEWVFGLTGGELDDKPLTFRTLDQWGEEHDRTWLYHYDGVPEWASSDFGSRYSGRSEGNTERFTLVEVGCSYGSGAPESLTTPDGKIYTRVAQYAHSGETECPMGSCGDDETVGEDSTHGFERCPLCDEAAGEKHGYIYVGDGCESVYARVDFECAECHVLASDCGPDAPMCDCEEA